MEGKVSFKCYCQRGPQLYKNKTFNIFLNFRFFSIVLLSSFLFPPNSITEYQNVVYRCYTGKFNEYFLQAYVVYLVSFQLKGIRVILKEKNV